MSEPRRSLDRIAIPVPCDADWNAMRGSEQVRFCEHCNLKLLNDAGAGVDAGDKDGNTALMIAVDSDRDQIILALIKAGAKIDATDNDGWTALMRANEPETVLLLVNAGADLTIRNKEGQTALSLARKGDQEEIVKLLKSRGAPE